LPVCAARGAQPHLADLEIFLEAIGLQQVRQLQRAHVATARSDFTLQVNNDGTNLREGVPGSNQFVPLALSTAMKRQGLTGQFAIQTVGLFDL
jgi:hypothetical protein